MNRGYVMNRDQFLNDKQVELFISWLAVNANNISIDLEISRSNKVPSSLSGFPLISTATQTCRADLIVIS